MGHLLEESNPNLQATSRSTTRLCQLAAQILRTPRSAIQGPHGSGKSTLIAALIPHLVDDLDEKRVRHWVLHDDCRQKVWLGQIRHLASTLPAAPASRQPRRETRLAPEAPLDPAYALPNGLLIVDGYEQLTWYGRRVLARFQRKIEWNLLITTHDPVRGFENLLTTAPDRATAEQLLHFLLEAYPECQPELLKAFPAAWEQSAGNFRQLWSILYDSYESFVNSPPQSRPSQT